VRGGVLEAACGQLLRDFFVARRVTAERVDSDAPPG
jgi:hypothetical protein